MTYDASTRDRYQRLVAALSGTVAAGVLVGTGAIAGHAARDLREDEAAEQARRFEELAAWQAEQRAYERELRRSERAARDVVLKQRPTATRVTTRYVGAASSGGPVAVEPGSGGGPGTGSGAAPSSGGGGGGSSGGGSGGGGGTGGSGGPPPPPPPPPATSGS